MTSAIHRHSRHWARLRAGWQVRIDQAGGLPCWRCGRTIVPGDPWDLGHVIARALGGTDDDLAPEHRHCSRVAGGELGLAIKRGEIVSEQRQRVVRLVGRPGELFGEEITEPW